MEICTFEQAVALKEAGFDKPTFYYYHPKVEKVWHSLALISYNTQEGLSDLYVSAPTLHEAADFLRGCDLHIRIEPNRKWDSWDYFIDRKESTPICNPSLCLDTYSLALSAGITRALELLTTQKSGK